MKKHYLLLLLVCLASVGLHAQNMVSVNATLLNFNGGAGVTGNLIVDVDSNITNSQLVFNEQGFAADTIVVDGSWGLATLVLTSCAGDTMSQTQYFDADSLQYVNFVMEYCTEDTTTTDTTQTEPCEAHFYFQQAYSPDSTPAAGEVILYDNSTGGSGDIDGYFWDFGDGVTSTQITPEHTYDKEGMYMVCLTIYNTDSCSSTYCDTLTVDDMGFLKAGFRLTVINLKGGTNVGSIAPTILANVYPNPVKSGSSLAVDFNAIFSGKVAIHNLQGQKVFETEVKNQSQIQIPVQEMPSGLYLLQVGNSIQKFLVD